MRYLLLSAHYRLPLNFTFEGLNGHFRQARIVFDAFHSMKMAGQALDKVRKDLARQGADLNAGL